MLHVEPKARPHSFQAMALQECQDGLLSCPRNFPIGLSSPTLTVWSRRGAGGAEEPRSRADGDALGDQPEPDGREEHDAPDDEGDGAQDDPLIMMGRRVEQLEGYLADVPDCATGLDGADR